MKLKGKGRLRFTVLAVLCAVKYGRIYQFCYVAGRGDTGDLRGDFAGR